LLIYAIRNADSSERKQRSSRNIFRKMIIFWYQSFNLLQSLFNKLPGFGFGLHWVKKLDQDPNWNQCRSGSKLKLIRIRIPHWFDSKSMNTKLICVWDPCHFGRIRTSMPLTNGSGSNPNHSIFIIDLQDANKKQT
jgi:hypothetical protein